ALRLVLRQAQDERIYAHVSANGCSFQPRQIALDCRSELVLAMLQRQLLRVGGPLDAFGPVASPHVRSGEREQISRHFGVARLNQLLEFDNCLVGPPERQEHASQIEPPEPERGLTVDGLAIRGRRLIEATVALENLSEVVVRQRVTGIDRNRLPVCLGSWPPAFLKAEQHTVVVV